MVLTYLEIKAGVYDEPCFQFLRFLDDSKITFFSHIFFVLIGNVIILLKVSFPSRNAKFFHVNIHVRSPGRTTHASENFFTLPYMYARPAAPQDANVIFFFFTLS